jgi:DNA primase
MTCTREEMASALISLGYKVDSSWFTNLRDETTASVLINTDGSYHDYGTGEHGDLINVLMEYHKYKDDFPAAKAEAHRLLGLEVKVDFTKFDKSSGEVDDSPLPEHFMVPHRIDRKNNFQSYLKELKQLFLGEYDGKQLLSADWAKVLEVSKKYDISYSKKSGRLIMPIKDIDGEIRTFWKYKKTGEDFIKDDKTYKHRKVLYTKGKSRPPFAITDILEFAKTPDVPVVITEGEKDALISNANGLNAICIGGAGASKKLNEKYLHLFSGLNIIIAGDYDKAGYEFNKNLLEQLKPIAKTVTILRWENKAKEDGFKLHDKFDLADYFAWKNNKEGML